MTTALNRQNFRGPWAGLPVAWDNRDRFDEDAYRRDVKRCCEARVPGVYTGGTSGEFYAMEFDEFKAVALATVAVCRDHQVPSMIGCTSTYTLGAARRAAFAAEAGADAIQVALPFWMEVSDDQIVSFFREVAAAAPGLVLSVYETTRAKKILTLDHHRRIKDAVPNYLMVKSNASTLGCSKDGCLELSKLVNVFTGESTWASLGPVGAVGCCSALVYWFPRYTLDLWRDLEAKNWPAVTRRCAELDALMTQVLAITKDRGFTDSAYDRMGGLIIPFLSTNLQCRKPYPHATESDVAALRRWCEKNNPELLKL